ncbi:sulfotransferase [uncultured Oceanicoccus sp.]|uniref:sulfotransferase n=1 Tax=uncultured Oceanicoccus sp. TaxID=1706381 RepID=UPI0030D787E1
MIKFVLLGVQRTGTTVLRTTLNNHSKIRCTGEVFKIGTWNTSAYEGDLGYEALMRNSVAGRIRHYIARGSNTTQYLDKLYMQNGYEAIGFKLMFNQTGRFPAIIPYLKSNKIKLIHLVRENYLKTHISALMANKRGFHSTKAVKQIKLIMPVRDLVYRLDCIKNESDQWANIFSESDNYLRVTYEDFMKSRDEQISKIVDFLGIEKEEISSDLVKLTSDDLSEVLENYEDVKSKLLGTQYEALI